MVSPFDARDARCLGRADERGHLMGTQRRRWLYRIELCLPTAPATTAVGNGDFGTSPIFGQLSDNSPLTDGVGCRT